VLTAASAGVLVSAPQKRSAAVGADVRSSSATAPTSGAEGDTREEHRGHSEPKAANADVADQIAGPDHGEEQDQRVRCQNRKHGQNPAATSPSPPHPPPRLA
jgi:hypothetical protein